MISVVLMVYSGQVRVERVLYLRTLTTRFGKTLQSLPEHLSGIDDINFARRVSYTAVEPGKVMILYSDLARAYNVLLVGQAIKNLKESFILRFLLCRRWGRNEERAKRSLSWDHFLTQFQFSVFLVAIVLILRIEFSSVQLELPLDQQLFFQNREKSCSKEQQ